MASTLDNNNTDDTSPISTLVDGEFVYEVKVYKNVLPTIISLGVMAYLIWPYVPRWFSVLWLVLLVSLVLFRKYVLPDQRKIHIDIPSWGFRQAGEAKYFHSIYALHITVGIQSCIMASVLLFQGDYPLSDRLLISMILLISVSISTIISAGHQRVHLIYSSPILSSLLLAWTINPQTASPGKVEYSFAVLIVIFIFLICASSSYIKQLFQQLLDEYTKTRKLRIKLEKAVDKAEQGNRAKTRFLAAASHDLRQPIHTLSLLSAALKLQNLTGQPQVISEKIDAGIQSAATQLDALLDISKLDAGLVEINQKPVNLYALCLRLKDDFRPHAEKKRLAFQIHCEQKIFVLVDKFLLERILRNLLSNSIKYTKQGSVTLRVIPDSKEVRILVQDTGHGIAKEKQKHVFEGFYQINPTGESRTKGLGLGLSIVKRLCDMLDIEISLSSVLHQGTSISLQLPKIEPPQTPMSPKIISKDLQIERITVLVVDDEVNITDSMKILLEAKGFEVKVANTAKRALDILNHHNIDLLLVDFLLNDGNNGIELVNEARNNQADMPALLISGDSKPGFLKLAQEAGLQVLQKPVQARQLFTSIFNILKQKHALEKEAHINNQKHKHKHCNRELCIIQMQFRRITNNAFCIQK